MSGICGIIHFDGAPVERPVLQKMTEAAAHRGPDGIRCWTGDGAGLAHLALHVTPEDLREHQPLAEGKLVLAADARIDNRSALIRLLDAPPEATDAALILAAYGRWGAECAKRFVGDFAFAVWDAEKRQLFAARDGMAMRPLYYRRERREPGRLLFASEVKQLLAAPGVPAHVNEATVGGFLAGRFDFGDETFYTGIHQLQAGHALLTGPDGLRTWRYFDLDPGRRIRYASPDEYAEHFLALFEEALRCRLRSTQPAGIFLSGGMDSASAPAMGGQLLRRGCVRAPELRTYSFAFETLPQCDERAVSDRIARHYDLPATSIDAEAAAPLRGYPAHGPDRDTPYGGVYQAVIEHTLARAQADGVRLMLSGDRGDLLMGEYIYDYLGLLWRGHWRMLLRELRRQAAWRDASLGAMARKYLYGPLRGMIWPRRRAAWLRRPLRRMYRTLRPAKPAEAAPSYPPWIRPALVARAGLEAFPEASGDVRRFAGRAQQQRYHAILTPMHMQGVVWSERTAARFGLSFVDPWSDTRLAQFALAVPQRVLNATGAEKRLVRYAMRGVMPEAARRQAGKVSPYPLYERALKEQARETILDLITDMKAAARGYVDEEALRRHYAALREGEAEHPFFWWALALEMWLRRYGA